MGEPVKDSNGRKRTGGNRAYYLTGMKKDNALRLRGDILKVLEFYKRTYKIMMDGRKTVLEKLESKWAKHHEEQKHCCSLKLANNYASKIKELEKHPRKNKTVRTLKRVHKNVKERWHKLMSEKLLWSILLERLWRDMPEKTSYRRTKRLAIQKTEKGLDTALGV